MSDLKPKVPVWRLIGGDLIDLFELPPHIVLDDSAATAAEYELACVEDVVAESNSRVVVYTDQASYALPHDHEFTVHAQVIRLADRDPRPGGPLLPGETGDAS